MTNALLEAALVEEPENAHWRSEFLHTFAPAPFNESSVDKAWQAADLKASIATLCIAAPATSVLVLSRHIGPHTSGLALPDYFLADLAVSDDDMFWGVRGEHRNPVDSESDEESPCGFLHLVRLHQQYYGPVSSAMSALIALVNHLGGLDDDERAAAFRKIVFESIALSNDHSVPFQMASPESMAGAAFRAMAEFYDLLTDKDAANIWTSGAADLARVRFSRFLTAFESLDDFLSDSEGDQSHARRLAKFNRVAEGGALPSHDIPADAFDGALPGLRNVQVYVRGVLRSAPELAPA